MTQVDISSDELLSALLTLAEKETVCVLDSCGVGYLDSHLMIGGIGPTEVFEITNDDANETLAFIDTEFAAPRACIFTLSYDLGRKLLNVNADRASDSLEPDLFLAVFDVLIVHDYASGITRLTGNSSKFEIIEAKLRSHISNLRFWGKSGTIIRE